MHINWIRPLLATGAAMAWAAAAQAQPAPAQPGSAEAQALIARTCYGCHAPADITRKGDSAQGWSDTVDRMAGYGAAATPEELAEIKAYLARTAPATGGAPAPKTP